MLDEVGFVHEGIVMLKQEKVFPKLLLQSRKHAFIYNITVLCGIRMSLNWNGPIRNSLKPQKYTKICAQFVHLLLAIYGICCLHVRYQHIRNQNLISA